MAPYQIRDVRGCRSAFRRAGLQQCHRDGRRSRSRGSHQNIVNGSLLASGMDELRPGSLSVRSDYVISPQRHSRPLPSASSRRARCAGDSWRMARLRHQNSAAKPGVACVAGEGGGERGLRRRLVGRQAERLDGCRPVWPDVIPLTLSAKLERMVLCARDVKTRCGLPTNGRTVWTGSILSGVPSPECLQVLWSSREVRRGLKGMGPIVHHAGGEMP